MAQLTSFSVQGFKSVRDKTTIDLPGLTILAGANSSGKSSVLQPLLLFKQTLQSEFQPEGLRLSGPNLKFSDAGQLFWSAPGVTKAGNTFTVSCDTDDGETFEVTHAYQDSTSLSLVSTLLRRDADNLLVRVPSKNQEQQVRTLLKLLSYPDANLESLLSATAFLPSRIGHSLFLRDRRSYEVFPVAGPVKSQLAQIIHLPGLRGTPERTYRRTGNLQSYPGLFQDYFATILHSWKSDDSYDYRKQVAKDLRDMGLAWKIETKSIDAANIEVKVTRLPSPKQGGARDMVSLADTGLGVSQVLPIITSLYVAQRGQLVYIEQPEIHLHPRAQQALAPVLYAAVTRGVILIVETHSEVLIDSLLTMVAAGEADPNRIKLYWATRDESGSSVFSSTSITEGGRIEEDFPIDFSAVRREILQRRLQLNYPA